MCQGRKERWMEGTMAVMIDGDGGGGSEVHVEAVFRGGFGGLQISQ